MIGTLLKDRYRIDARLGEGGMGVVYRAHDRLLDRPVAIKTLAPGLFLGEEGARRFLREAQSAARLNHPHIVSTYDAVEDGGSFAIVMELVEGKTLRELLPIPLDRLIQIAIQILQGLEYAHAQGIVHRDIKPENIVITADAVAKLMDFGLARSEGRSRLTQAGLIVGTVAYLAPEQALGGQVDGRSDLYSLGVVLYEAAAGRLPFEADDPITIISQHINVPPVAPHWHNPSVPQGIENVIVKLLAKDPTRRYQTAQEVISALVAAQPASTAAALPDLGEREKLAGPTLVERLARSPLVGRDADLARLKELVDETVAGRGAVALATGPLGVGKTRLVEEVITYAHLRGMAVVSGKAYDSAPPYEPFARALRALARGVDADTLAARLGEFAPELVGLIPELDRQLPRSGDRIAASPEDRKNRLLSGVAHFLGTTAAAVPTLLFLDDMHLTDLASVELLQHVARRAEAGRALIVVAYRPEEIPKTPAGKMFNQVTHALGREEFCARLALRPLTEEQVIDMIQELAHHRSRPVRFGQRIFEVTEGNPYFIEEVIKGLFEQSILYVKDGQWSTDFDELKDYSLLEIPSSVHGAVETRLRNLGDETRQALAHAAVIGRQFSFDVLLAVTGTEEGQLLDRVEEAIRAQLIREVRGSGEDLYEFAQPMLRQVLYDAIPRRRRRQFHRQVGEALERLYGANSDPCVEMLADHFGEAEDAERTLRYAHQAASKAARIFAYDEAATHVRRAIAAAEELDRPQARLELLEELGDVLFWTGRREEAVRTLEDALHLWKSLPGPAHIDGARLCRKLGELGSRWAAHNPRTRDHIMEGLRLLENDRDHPERIKLIVAKASDHYWLRPERDCDYAAAEASAHEAYRLAETIGSLQDMSAALDALAGLYLQTAQFQRMLEATRQRVPIVEQLNDSLEQSDLEHMLCFAHEMLGNFAEALEHAALGYELTSRAGRPWGRLQSCQDAIRICTAWNRWHEGERWCRLYDEAEGRLGRPYAHRRFSIACRAQAAAIRGDIDAARRHEAEFETVPAGHPSLRWVILSRRLATALAIGDLTKSGALVEEGLRVADTPVAKLEFHTVVLQFACQAGEWRHVDELGGTVHEQARRSGGRRFLALNCRALGIHCRELGQLDEAVRLLVEATDLFRALDCRYELGSALRELALARRLQGHAEDTARLLEQALACFEALEAGPDVQRTRALM